jgi:hypothetical protein
MMDHRAVTVPVQYTLLLATLALLASGLFVGMGGFVTNEQSQAAQGALETIGERVASDLAAADRLAAPLDGTGEFSLAIDAPESVAGTTYTITIEDATGNDDRSRLVLETVRPAVSVATEIETEVPLLEGSVSGGRLVVVYDPSSDRLEVRND